MRAVVAIAIIGFASGVAGAETTEDALKRGVRAYATAKFRDAIRVLTGVARGTGSEALRVRAWKYIGASHLAVGNRAAAKEAIALLLGVDPTATFEAGRFPKRVLVMFDEVRKGLSGKIVVACDRPETKVEVAGHKSAPCGDFDAVPIGQQVVKATAPDEPAMTRDVVVHVGKGARVEFKFGPGFGFLTLTTTPPDAVVTLDGQPAATTPLSKYRLSVGRHTIVVEAAGYRDKTQSVDISRGVESLLTIALQKTLVVVAPPIPAVTRVKSPLVKTAPKSKTRNAVGWTLVGTGAAAFVSALVLQIYAVSRSAKLEAQNESATGSNSTGDMKSIETVDRVAKGLFIGAGVTALAGTIVLLVRGKASAANPTQGMSLTVGALPTFGGVPILGVGPRWHF